MPKYRTNDGRTFVADSPDDLVTQLRNPPADPLRNRPVFEPGTNTNEEFRRQSAERATAQTRQPDVSHTDSAAWLEDLKRRGLIEEIPPAAQMTLRMWSLGSANPPDFEHGVAVVLTTFAVFTGFTINGYLQDSIRDIGDTHDWHWWGFFALIALLLRYIFGSAIHLNGTYVGKSILRNGQIERAPPKSKAVTLLFKDLMFLVLFGMLAIYIIQAAGSVKGYDPGSFDDFIERSMWFVGAGFLWSVTDFLIRRVWARAANWNADDPWWHPWQMLAHDILWLIIWLIILFFVVYVGTDQLDGDGDIRSLPFDRHYAYAILTGVILLAGVIMAVSDWRVCKRYPFDLPEAPPLFWRIWVTLDGLQFVSTWGILAAGWTVLCTAKAMAALYIGFLFCDFFFTIRAVQLHAK